MISSSATSETDVFMLSIRLSLQKPASSKLSVYFIPPQEGRSRLMVFGHFNSDTEPVPMGRRIRCFSPLVQRRRNTACSDRWLMSHLQAGNDPVMMLNRSNCDGAVQPVEYNSRITRQFISHFSPAGMPPVSDAITSRNNKVEKENFSE